MRFWVVIALASAFSALAAASLSAAAFSAPLPDPDVHAFGYRELFGAVVSLEWTSDRGFLLAAIAFGALAVGAYVVAVRSR